MKTQFKTMLGNITAQASQMRTRVKELDDAIGAHRTRIGRLLAAPLPPSDVLTYLCGNVDNVAGTMVPSLSGEIRRLASQPFEEWERTKESGSELARLCTGGRGVPFPVIEEALYYFMADAFKKRLTELVGACLAEQEDEISKLSAEQRRAEIDRLHAELHDLVREREELVAHLKAVGLDVAEPEVKAIYSSDEIKLMSFGVVPTWSGQRVYGPEALQAAQEMGLYAVMAQGYEAHSGETFRGYAALVAMREEGDKRI
ncbi:hypothetical protein LBW59_11785 [Ralstonia solanacearum]|uniref:Uncharacterized protein n=1 Tax=Ralstonia solanacearum TaxID=305 RepID=A0AAW5ZM76_RALSL|nr:hypothetical protein [Ralstonia solanacearum]MDB0571450.1 hypothetical protein [Ralstonia solanacearum]